MFRQTAFEAARLHLLGHTTLACLACLHQRMPGGSFFEVGMCTKIGLCRAGMPSPASSCSCRGVLDIPPGLFAAHCMQGSVLEPHPHATSSPSSTFTPSSQAIVPLLNSKP